MVSVAVLAYNELECLRVLLPQLNSTCSQVYSSFEILVVDDCSTDGSDKWLIEIQAEFPSVRTVRHDRNRGYAAATRTALCESVGEYLVVMDGDGQHSPLQVVQVISALARGADVVLPLRKTRVDSISRKLASWILTFECRLLLGFPQRDINGGIKGMKAKAASKIKIIYQTNLVNPEIWVRARNNSLTVRFVEVDQLQRIDGSASRVMQQRLLLLFKVSRYITRLAREINRTSQPVVGLSNSPNATR